MPLGPKFVKKQQHPTQDLLGIKFTLVSKLKKKSFYMHSYLLIIKFIEVRSIPGNKIYILDCQYSEDILPWLFKHNSKIMRKCKFKVNICKLLSYVFLILLLILENILNFYDKGAVQVFHFWTCFILFNSVLHEPHKKSKKMPIAYKFIWDIWPDHMCSMGYASGAAKI